VTSEFNVTVVRRITPNSHDQFLNSRQLDKATVQLAANANDPHIKSLIAQLLNENQSRVDSCHASQEGQALMKTFMDKKRVSDVTKAERLKEKKYKGKASVEANEAVKELAKQPAKETAQLEALGEASESDQPKKRIRRKVERYSPLDYHDTLGHKLSEEERAVRSKQAVICDICFKLDRDDCGVCMCCCILAHFRCHGVEQTADDFVCRRCADAQTEAVRSVGKAKRQARNDDDSVSEDMEDKSEDELEGSSDDDFIEKSESYGEEEADEDFELADGDLDTASEELSTSAEYSESENSDNESTIRSRGLKKHQLRENILGAIDEVISMKTAELDEFVSEEQPDDVTRHRLALLQITQGKTWTEEDLQDEGNLRLGLHLLFNKINGNETLAFGKSIHIKYDNFPKDITAAMEQNRAVTAAQRKAAKAKAL
jgi:hypothetical protein